jgi:hypothetical protein
LIRIKDKWQNLPIKRIIRNLECVISGELSANKFAIVIDEIEQNINIIRIQDDKIESIYIHLQ